jgi:hypothetical protein
MIEHVMIVSMCILITPLTILVVPNVRADDP